MQSAKKFICNIIASKTFSTSLTNYLFLRMRSIRFTPKNCVFKDALSVIFRTIVRITLQTVKIIYIIIHEASLNPLYIFLTTYLFRNLFIGVQDIPFRTPNTCLIFIIQSTIFRRNIIGIYTFFDKMSKFLNLLQYISLFTLLASRLIQLMSAILNNKSLKTFVIFLTIIISFHTRSAKGFPIDSNVIKFAMINSSLHTPSNYPYPSSHLLQATEPSSFLS